MTGYFFAPTAETATFQLSADDGAILTIGGQTIINNDGDHDMRYTSPTGTVQTVNFNQPGYCSMELLLNLLAPRHIWDGIGAIHNAVPSCVIVAPDMALKAPFAVSEINPGAVARH